MSENQSPKSLPAARRRARKLAMQAIYQWQIADTPVNELLAQFVLDNDMSKVDQAYFNELVRSVPGQKANLDETIEGFVDRDIKKMTPVELAILRLGTYELLHRLDVPYRVVINEGVELAKNFGATDGHKYVNGVLDKMARKLRATEAGK